MPGDAVMVTKLDRLARSSRDLHTVASSASALINFARLRWSYSLPDTGVTERVRLDNDKVWPLIPFSEAERVDEDAFRPSRK